MRLDLTSGAFTHTWSVYSHNLIFLLEIIHTLLCQIKFTEYSVHNSYTTRSTTMSGWLQLQNKERRWNMLITSSLSLPTPTQGKWPPFIHTHLATSLKPFPRQAWRSFHRDEAREALCRICEYYVVPCPC